MNKIEMVRELTEQSTENYKVYLMSDGSQQMVFTPSSANENSGIMLLSEDSEVSASASSDITLHNWTSGALVESSENIVGKIGDAVHRLYMTVTVPTLPNNPRIRKVELCLGQSVAPVFSGDAPRLALHTSGEISEDTPDPNLSSQPVDYEKLTPDDSDYRFDITRLLTDTGTTTLRFALKLIDETVEAYTKITAPTICVNYQSNFGVNSGYRACTQDLGFFGQGSVDLIARNLTFDCTDFAWAGNRMPVTLKHQYTSALSDIQYNTDNSIGLKTANFSAMNVGRGWRLNFMQSITESLDEDGNCIFTYMGENGEQCVFKESEQMSTPTDPDVASYNLFECDTDSSILYDPEQKKLTTGDEEYFFDGSGRLIQIKNSYGDSIDITYTENKLTKITDGVGREFSLEYTDGYLTKITAPDGNCITYAYSAGRLTSVTYPTNEKAQITYSGYKPQRVTLMDKDGNSVYAVEYTFSGDNVTRTQEFGFDDETEVAGARSVFTNESKPYRMKITTTQPAQSEDESDEVTVTYYTFDDDGNVIGEYMANAETGNIGVEDSQNGIYPISDGSAQVTNVTNLLRDHNFEGTYSSTTDFCNIENVETEEHSKFGKKVRRVEYKHESGSITTTLDEVSLPAGEYTFSAYVKTTDNFAENCGTYLVVEKKTTDDEGNVTYPEIAQSEKICEYTGEFMRIALPFTLSEEMTVRPGLCVKGMGVAYFDATQLENNPFVSPYNMLINGNFELGKASNNEAYGWTLGSSDMASNIALNSTNYFSKNYCLDIIADLDSESYMYQDISVKSAADTRETFTLGGWAKGYSTVIREREGCETPHFCLKAEIFYKDGTTEPFTADFSDGSREWQFASVSFSKSEFKEVEKLRVYCDYSYNTSKAYFDDIFLIRDSIETELSASDFASTDYEETEAEETLPDTMASFDAPEFEELLDSFGNALTETTFTDGEFGTIYRSFGYTEGANEGNDLVRETDARGNNTVYDVNLATSRNEVVYDRCNNITEYEYDAKGRTTKVISKKADDTELANVSYSYDAFDNLSEIVRGDGMKYVLNYNAFHNLESIGIDGKTDGNLISYTYKNGSGRLKELAYANGGKMKATYNSYGQLVSETWTNSENVETARYKYAYDGQGNIVRSIDIKAEKEYTYYYEDGSLVRSAEYTITLDENEFVTARTLVSSIAYVYEEGKLVRKHIRPENSAEQIIYYESSDDNNVVTKFKVGDTTVTSHSKTDSFGRKIFDELQFGSGVVSRSFTYHVGEISEEHQNGEKIKSSPTTQLVKEITYPDGSTLTYEYDNEERITSVVHKYKDGDNEVVNTTEYTYDALGQLLTETVNGATTKFVYDNYGNIIEKGLCDDDGNIIAESKKTYVYGKENWKDLLTSYNGQTITYDAQGNPTSYFGEALTWEKGRQLKTFGQESFEYNANGIRTFKTGHGENHYYTLEGTKIVCDSWTQPITKEARTIVSLYDNEDSVCGIIYNNVPYYFYKNLQGDIIAILDANGNTVGRYSYDAWGVPTILENTSSDFVASYNPFLYRGYYYDWDTGLYYLQSRYYDPTTGRFINGDELTYLGASGTNLGQNLFVYCENNTTNRIDSQGNTWVKIVVGIVIVVATVVLIGSTLHKAYQNYNYNYRRERTDIVYGQYSVDMKFANSTIYDAGCGIVAAYNAIRLLGKWAYLSDIVLYFDKRNAVTGNLWAAPFWDVAGCIRSYTGYKTKTKLFPKTYDSHIKKSSHKMGVIAYNWHYFLAKWNSKTEKFITYNRYSGDTGTRSYPSIDEELKGKKHLCLVTF